MKPVYRLLTQLSSRRTVSKLSGKLAKSRWSKRLIPHFVKIYNINVHEAEKKPEEYPTLNAFFTRRMKQGSRPIVPGEETIVSPVDGRVTGMGKIKDGIIFNVKGQTYTLEEMLADTKKEKFYKNGSYLILYLSPTDYHRIHAPFSGEIVHTAHQVGTVYPVNEFGLLHMKKVLSRNERLITYLRNSSLEAAIVKVGAMNVASIRWSDRLTSTEIEKGEELAFFEFGSTVVLLFPEGCFHFHEQLHEGMRMKVGEQIGWVFHTSR